MRSFIRLKTIDSARPIASSRDKRRRRPRSLERLESRTLLTVATTDLMIQVSPAYVAAGQPISLEAVLQTYNQPVNSLIAQPVTVYLDGTTLLELESESTGGGGGLNDVHLPAGNHLIAASYAGEPGVYGASSTGSQVTTFAGGGTNGDGGLATATKLVTPQAVGVDAQGDVFIADAGANVIREVNRATGVVSTVAGTGTAGFSGDGASAIKAKLNYPAGVAVDPEGDLFIADYNNDRVREVDHASGIITTVAGAGNAGSAGDGGPATSAQLKNPLALAVDSQGNLFIADLGNEKIREVDHLSGVITTVAGNGAAGSNGDGGPATSAELGYPNGLAAEPGTLFISDSTNNRIREVDLTSGKITTVAGTGAKGFAGDGGPATKAELDQTGGVALDDAGNLLIADSGNFRVRKLDLTSGNISTVAGYGAKGYSDGWATSATFDGLQGLAVDPSGDVLIVDKNNQRIRELSNGIPISVIAPAPYATSVSVTVTPDLVADGQTVTLEATVSDNNASNKPIYGPVTFKDGDTVLGTNDLEDEGLGAAQTKITQVTLPPGEHHISASYGGYGDYQPSSSGLQIATIAGGGAGLDNGPAATAKLEAPYATAVDAAGNVFIADPGGNRIREVNLATGAITTVAGDGTKGFKGDGGLATSAELSGPVGIALDAVGNVFIADEGNQRIREVVHATGIIITVAGDGTAGFKGDGGPPSAAEFSLPLGVAVDAAGDLFIADAGNQRIREVVHATGNIITVAGNGTLGFSGDGFSATSAELHTPYAVAVDASGNLFIADSGNKRIRVVDTSGNISTVAGNGSATFKSGTLANSTGLLLPLGVAVDAAGDIFISDSALARVLEVDHATGIINTVAGNGNQGFNGDGSAGAELSVPRGIAVDAAGNLFIADTGNARVREVTNGALVTVAPTTFTGASATGGVEAVTPAMLTGAAFTDVGGGAASGFTIAAVDWGDGDTSTTGLILSGSNGSYTVAGSHLYREEGPHPFSITVKDAGGNPLTITGTANVADAPLSGTSATIATGTNVSGTVASFSDPDMSDTTGDYQASIDWGDGHTDAGSIVAGAAAGQFDVTGSHNYADGTAHTIAVVITHGTDQPLVVQSEEPGQSKSQGTFGLVDDVYVIGSGTVTVTADNGVLKNDVAPSQLTVTAGTVAGANGGTFVFNADGSFTYTPPADFPGFDDAQYTASDAQGDHATATVNVLSQTGGVVWKFYESVLNRAPDYDGLKYWIHDFTNGGKTGDIAVGFFESDELLNSILGGYYQQYLGRALDPAGLAYWKGVWHSTGGPEGIKAGFAASPEFNTNAGGSGDGWLTALYARILDRTPDPQGFSYWQQRLAQGTPESSIALGFFDSLEGHKNDVTGWFNEYLGRAPSDAELTQYANEMMAGKSDRDIEQQITNLPEYSANPPASPAGTAATLPDYFPPVTSAGGQQQAVMAAKEALFSRLGD